MTTDAGALAGSRAVLIGVSAYEHAEFPPIRAARNSLQAMQSLLADPALCGWPPELITEIANPISAADLADRIADRAQSTTGVLLLYYVGQGVLSTGAELYLTVTSTRPDRPKISGLPWDTVADVLRNCPARVRLVILDCCFAGQAIQTLAADGAPGFADMAHVEGVYTLAATTRNRTAHVPPAHQQDTACTSFTGQLRDLIRSGIPGGPSQLTFGDIYPVLRQRLRARGLPIPSQCGTDTVFQFPFTANAAAHLLGDGGTSASAVTLTAPTPVRIDRYQAIHLLDDAERAAHSITSERSRVSALADVATALATTDPVRAERVAQSITSDRSRASALTTSASAAALDPWESNAAKASALADVATALTATDPDRAERVAKSITDMWYKASALTAVATALTATDPDRAERVARSITSDRSRVSALAGVATALAVTDPDRATRLIAEAECIARSITSRRWTADKRLRIGALLDVARALAASDPDRAARLIADAEGIAESIVHSLSSRDWALADVATALAASDPDRAERLARSITSDRSMPWVLPGIARTLAATDPDRAERVAQSITNKESQASALVSIAKIGLHGL